MGRVFTPEEITQDRLPRPAQFMEAAQFLLGAMTNYYDGDPYDYFPQTHGALIFGSTTTESATIRSDLDILVAYTSDDHTKSDKLLVYREMFWSVKTLFGVPVESTIESIENLRNGNHSIDDIFLPNLGTVPNEWSVGSNPVPEITPHNKAGIEVFNSYAKAKDRKLGKALTDSTDIDVKAFQRALELPVALARKAIAVLAADGSLPARGIPLTAAVSKQAVIEQVRILPTSDKVSAPFTELLAIDSSYTELVEAVAAKQSDAKEHQQWVDAYYLSALTKAIEYNDGLSRYIRMLVR